MEFRKIRRRLRREYFKKIQNRKVLTRLGLLTGGKLNLEFGMIRRKSIGLVKLLSLLKRKIDKYKNKPEVFFKKSVNLRHK